MPSLRPSIANSTLYAFTRRPRRDSKPTSPIANRIDRDAQFRRNVFVCASCFHLCLKPFFIHGLRITQVLKRYVENNQLYVTLSACVVPLVLDWNVAIDSAGPAVVLLPTLELAYCAMQLTVTAWLICELA
jgi:hypothetical protein